MKKVFFLIPADTPHGPIKGAFALANAMAKNCDVTVVALKKGPGSNCRLAENVKFVCLQDHSSLMLLKYLTYRRYLRKAAKDNTVSISMCFSADLMNAFCGQIAKTFSSVRGNLRQNYRMDFGRMGVVLSKLHMYILRYLGCVTTMTRSMSNTLESESGLKSVVIGNCVDEQPLLGLPKACSIDDRRIRLVFVGSLTNRKQPELLLEVFSQLVVDGYDIELSILGDGPLRASLANRVKELLVDDRVTLYGFHDSPCSLVALSDVFVLPSLSEGLSRAALEALCVGVPCVLRNVDGNSELINDGGNGFLFEADHELRSAIIRALEFVRAKKNSKRESLIPLEYTQKYCAERYIELFEGF